MEGWEFGLPLLHLRKLSEFWIFFGLVSSRDLLKWVQIGALRGEGDVSPVTKLLALSLPRYPPHPDGYAHRWLLVQNDPGPPERLPQRLA